MRVVSWNVGLFGLRGTRRRFGNLKRLLESLNADIVCFQETKLLRGDLDPEHSLVDGWHSFFSFSSGRTGYAGTATFCRDSALPFAAEEGLTGTLGRNGKHRSVSLVGGGSDGAYPELLERWSVEELQTLDAEGRCCITDHGTFVIFNIYAPAITSDDRVAAEERFTYKMRFYAVLWLRVESMRAIGRRVIILGDFNISPELIDSCDPAPPHEFLARPDRVLLNQKLRRGGGPFLDVFRHCHPGRLQAYTCWSQVTGARANNYGTRIDLILAADGLPSADGVSVDTIFTAADVSPEVEGSDHCPVWADITLPARLPVALVPPPLSSRLLLNKQQTIKSFFKRAPAKASSSQPLQEHLQVTQPAVHASSSGNEGVLASPPSPGPAGSPPDPTPRPGVPSRAPEAPMSGQNPGERAGDSIMSGVGPGQGAPESLPPDRGVGEEVERAVALGPGLGESGVRPPKSGEGPGEGASGRSSSGQGLEEAPTSTRGSLVSGVPLSCVPDALQGPASKGSAGVGKQRRSGQASMRSFLARPPIVPPAPPAEGTAAGNLVQAPRTSAVPSLLAGLRNASGAPPEDSAAGGASRMTSGLPSFSAAGMCDTAAAPSTDSALGKSCEASRTASAPSQAQCAAAPGQFETNGVLCTLSQPASGGLGDGGSLRTICQPADVEEGRGGMPQKTCQPAADDRGDDRVLPAVCRPAQAGYGRGDEGPSGQASGPWTVDVGGEAGAAMEVESASGVLSELQGTASSQSNGQPVSRAQAVAAWQRIQQLMKPPKCKGHGEECVVRHVKKGGVNQGRVFYVCRRPDGPKPHGRCDHFAWAADRTIRGAPPDTKGPAKRAKRN